MISFMANDLRVGEVDERVGQGDDGWDLGLELLWHGLESDCAVSQHDASAVHEKDCIHLRLNFEFLYRCFVRFFHVLWVIWGVFLELGLNGVSSVQENELFENDIVLASRIIVNVDSDDRPFVAQNVDFFFNVPLLDDDAHFVNLDAARVDAFGEEDGCEGFTLIESIFEGVERTVFGVYQNRLSRRLVIV